MQKIINKILSDTTVRGRSAHGREHWDRVAEYGRLIAKQENLNERILVLFAYFHDCKRLSDGTDPDHGPRAAKYVANFTPAELELSSRYHEKLIIACRHNTYECDTKDPTIRACWDAYRLDLGRVGILPDPKRLFTYSAKKIATGELSVPTTVAGFRKKRGRK